jgi:hypothetical protein
VFAARVVIPPFWQLNKALGWHLLRRWVDDLERLAHVHPPGKSGEVIPILWTTKGSK